MRAARLRLPQGCDLAYNVFQQVQARCTACGHYYGQCRHTAAPCAHASAVAEDEDAVATVAREHGLAELVRRHSERCQCPEPTPEGDIAALLDPPAPLDATTTLRSSPWEDSAEAQHVWGKCIKRW